MECYMDYKIYENEKYIKTYPAKWLKKQCNCAEKNKCGVVEDIRVCYCIKALPGALRALLTKYEDIVEEFMTPAPEEEQVMTTPTYQGYTEFCEYRNQIKDLMKEIETEFTAYYNII